MTFEQLDSLVAAADCATFLDAAESLHIAQSTISKQIKSLEKEIGIRLFERQGRNAVLTEAGHIFYDHAVPILQKYHQLLEQMDSIKNSDAHMISIGSIPILNQYGIAGLLREFHIQFPEFSTTVDECTEEQLLSGLDQGRFHFIITREQTINPAEHDFLPLAKDRLVVIVPVSHSFASREKISLTDLSEEKIIFIPPYQALQQLCEEIFARTSLPRTQLRTAHQETILGMVALNEGVSLFAEKNYHMFRSEQTIAVPLADSPTLLVGAARRKDSDNKKGRTGVFWDYLKAHAPILFR